MGEAGEAHSAVHTHDALKPVVSAYAALLEEMASVTTGRTRRGADGAVSVVSGAPIATMNGIISPALNPSPDEIATLVASESPWEVPWSIHVRGTPSPPVADLAARHGLTEFQRTPLMIWRPEERLPPRAGDSLRVRAVSADECGLYARTAAEGFEVPHEMFQILADPSVVKIPGVAFYLAEVNGVPVGTGMTAVSGELVGIFNIATLPGYRRRGYGRTITMEMVRAGFAAGASTAYLYASEMGERVYDSVGFRTEEYMTVIATP